MSERASVLASLILYDAELPITVRIGQLSKVLTPGKEENLIAVAKAGGVELEGIYAKIFAKALNGKDLSHLLGAIQVGTGGGAAPAAAASSGAAASAGESKKEEKVEEPEEEDDEMGFGLFD